MSPDELGPDVEAFRIIFKAAIQLMEVDHDNREEHAINWMADAIARNHSLKADKVASTLALHWHLLIQITERMDHIVPHIRGALVHQVLDVLYP